MGPALRACLIGAYPPSLSDASLRTYWAARGLAERGHQIFVVTGAADGGQCHLDEAEQAGHQPAFPARGGFARVFAVPPPVRPDDPGPGQDLGSGQEPGPGQASRLARCAADVIEQAGSGVVVAGPDEPYSAAGYLAARQAGSPLLISAAQDGHPVPAEVFHPDAGPLPVAEIDRLAAACVHRAGLRGRQPGGGLDPALPCLGSYDPPGSSRSAGLLLAALAALRPAGLQASGLLMTDPSQHASLWAAATASGLADSVRLLPVLPHWRLAGFIRRCTAICCLGPVGQGIAAETLACGGCLILAEPDLPGQSQADQLPGYWLEDGTNAVVLADAGAPGDLERRLRPLISQPEAAAAIGAAGLLVSRKFPAYPPFVDAWEARLGALSDPVRRPRRQPPASTAVTPGTGPGLQPGSDLLVEASAAAAARSCRGPDWVQFGLWRAAGRPDGRAELYAAIRAVSSRLLDEGRVSDFFFMHKPPGFRLRFQAAGATRPDLASQLASLFSRWQRSGLIMGWRPGVYEPEEHLFGGPVSMRSVHRIFTADSLAWLGFHAAGPDAGPGWAMSLLQIRALFEALHIDGWEDRDVWDRLQRQAGRRPPPATAARPELGQLAVALRTAWSARQGLAARLSPAAAELAGAYRAAVLGAGSHWRADYLASGDATVGGRELAAFLIVFHWNRAGFPAARQALLTEAMLAIRPGANR